MIKGKKASLRPVEVADRILLFELLNNQEVIQYVDVCLPFSMMKIEEIIKNLDSIKDMIIFMIQVEGAKSNHTVGFCLLQEISWVHRHANVSALIGEEHQGKEYDLYALELLINYGFNTVNLNRIAAYVHEKDEKSETIFQSLGFVNEGFFRQKNFTNGSFYGEKVYGLLREDWRGLQV